MSGRARTAVRAAPETAPEGRDAIRARIAALLESAPDPGAGNGRLAALASRFGLDPFESDALGLLWVCAFDPALRATLVPGEGFLTVRLAATLFRHDVRVRLASESPLLLWQMVREHETGDGGAALTIDPAIIAWLEDRQELDRALVGRVELLSPGAELAAWPLDAIAGRLREALHAGRRCRLHLVSDDGLAVSWFAAAIGLRLGQPVIRVPAGSMQGDGDAARLHRQAFLDGSILALAITDVGLQLPMGIVPYPIQIVCGEGRLPDNRAESFDLECRPATPDPEERERLWRRLWPQSATWPAAELADLALCHEADLGDIAAVAAAAPRDAETAGALLRERGRSDMGGLARRLETSFVWDDLVLPKPVEARLQEITFEARERIRLWSDPAAARLYPYGRGLTALFAGPPGSGKTMAARVIAADLGLDLLSVDLSAVVSKWVGETSKHLQMLFSSRSALRAVLFFDEADAIYARRVEEMRDAQDRHANLDTSHLMTALEAYPGIVVLATNLKANIDPAFLRRIRHVVDFGRPDAQGRESIWRKTLGALLPADQVRAIDPELVKVARIEATGALIKNAALSALFAMRRTGEAASARLLAEMLARELAKEGAGLPAGELDGMLGDKR